MRTPTSCNVATFGPFELDVKAGELHRDGRAVLLQEQPFLILKLLLERPGDLVTREDLRRRLWPNDTIVDFNQSINAAIKKLRMALDDSPEDPKYVETVARRGYRLIVPVEWREPSPAHPPAEAVRPAKPPGATGDLIGKKISHYRVLQVLGGGGMGVVYAAEDIKLGRRVALKLLPEELAGDDIAGERFLREARAASALNHPNICTIFAVEEHEGQPFIAMELLEGHTLREVIARSETGTGRSCQSRLQLPNLLEIAVQIARGLEAAHQKGIIHRDIKPANIFITSHGQAKILDFGLATLHAVEYAQVPADGEASGTRQSDPLLTLTRTGVTVGTAAYMSPEQVRGEKLDARTDLFSFGLVLYEMATGTRAFAGDTAPVLHNAILNDKPAAIRDLNPAIPSRLEAIIDKALQKNRETRYQTALEVRTHLERMQAHKASAFRWWWLGLAAIVLLAIASLWLANRQPPSLLSPSYPKLTQLTFNSAENHVTDGRISPDGRFLVYTDPAGMHLKTIETNEVHSIPLPRYLRESKMELALADRAWSRDSAKVLVNAYPAGLDVAALNDKELLDRGGIGIWEFAIPGGESRMLRRMAWAYSYSPDGSFISFGVNRDRHGPREIWLMDSDADHAHKILDAGNEYAIDTFTWSPDGHRVSYIRHNESTFEEIKLFWEADHLGREVQRVPVKSLFGTKNIYDGIELPGAREIFSVSERGAGGADDCNFWTLRLDPATGGPVDKPIQLTHLPGFCMTAISATTDGKRVAFVEWANHSQETIHLAELHATGTRVGTLRHFTLTDSTDSPSDWTPDSKTLIFQSSRGGHHGIYRQELNEDAPELLVADPRSQGRIIVSPDGKWLIYLQGPSSDLSTAPDQLMRVPIGGGHAQALFSLPHAHVETPCTDSDRCESQVWADCANSASDTCVILNRSEDRKAVIVTAFDPAKGLGAELGRIPLDPAMKVRDAALSRDGTHIVLLESLGRIRIVSMRGHANREFRVGDASDVINARWLPDGKALILSAEIAGRYVLLRVDLDGRTQRLLANSEFDVRSGLPSPDGRNLAIMTVTENKNMWMMENF